MSRAPQSLFADRGSASEIEKGTSFQPKFDGDGLIPAIVSDAATGVVLMFAWMNAEALALSIEHGEAYFWSRSRQRLWRKGEDSGNTLEIKSMHIDCDQDALLIKVEVRGKGVACHTGAVSCFYRSVPLGPVSMEGLKLKPEKLGKS